MKKYLTAALAASVVALSLGAAVPASAQGFAFSFNTGDVSIGYRDGYWDRYHHWHRWANSREAAAWRREYADRYNHEYHYRLRNSGWRDDDHDGIPNRYDRHPENPYRP